uniref:Ribosomal protein L5 n=1 Tax=Panagrolaimus sp. PS1159 TaxID=55785 RepID=A0AC35GXI2_9BILA
MSLNKFVTVTVNGPKTTILPLPSELVLNDTNYFILSNIIKWENNLKMDEKNQWKYTLLKNVTTLMFILDKNSPRNAVIFDGGENCSTSFKLDFHIPSKSAIFNGGENCSTSFKLDFHIPSKCEINFLYNNQKLKLKSESTEETLIGQKFKLFFHEGKLVGIQMHPFKVMELNVCEIETLAAHAWKIYDVKETCQNTNFIFVSFNFYF